MSMARRHGEGIVDEGWRKRNAKEMIKSKIPGDREQKGLICAVSGWPRSES